MVSKLIHVRRVLPIQQVLTFNPQDLHFNSHEPPARGPFANNGAEGIYPRHSTEMYELRRLSRPRMISLWPTWCLYRRQVCWPFFLVATLEHRMDWYKYVLMRACVPSSDQVLARVHLKPALPAFA